jgi:hypothetical protein
MDVLELPRPVINFLRTMSKEMHRYTLCWDIYGGNEAVTLTLTWKLQQNNHQLQTLNLNQAQNKNNNSNGRRTSTEDENDEEETETENDMVKINLSSHQATDENLVNVKKILGNNNSNCHSKRPVSNERNSFRFKSQQPQSLVSNHTKQHQSGMYQQQQFQHSKLDNLGMPPAVANSQIRNSYENYYALNSKSTTANAYNRNMSAESQTRNYLNGQETNYQQQKIKTDNHRSRKSNNIINNNSNKNPNQQQECSKCCQNCSQTAQPQLTPMPPPSSTQNYFTSGTKKSILSTRTSNKTMPRGKSLENGAGHDQEANNIVPIPIQSTQLQDYNSNLETSNSEVGSNPWIKRESMDAKSQNNNNNFNSSGNNNNLLKLGEPPTSCSATSLARSVNNNSKKIENNELDLITSNNNHNYFTNSSNNRSSLNNQNDSNKVKFDKNLEYI